MALKIAIAAAVLCALAGSADAKYTFKQKLPSGCDRAVDIVWFKNPGEIHNITLFAHGKFSMQTTLHKEGRRDPYTQYSLRRPDLAQDERHVKDVEWILGACVSIDDPNKQYASELFEPIVLTFDKREATVFHGIKCYKYTDVGGSFEFYGNDETGEFLGFRDPTESKVYSYRNVTAPFKADMFKFDIDKQPTCDTEAYKLPDLTAFNDACNNLPNSW